MIRYGIFIKTSNYIGKDYYNNEYIIAGDDLLMNIIIYQYSNNFSNIKLPGYLKFSIHKKNDENVKRWK